MLKWVYGQYGFEHAKIGKFRCSVGWDSMQSKFSEKPGGYMGSFDQFTLAKRYPTSDEAKRAVEQLARQVLTEALVSLGTSENEPKVL